MMPYDWGAMFPSQPVFRENEVQIFYGASDWYFFDWRKSGLAMATLRPDGWAGYEPSDKKKRAAVSTAPIVCTGDHLRVSADIQNNGWLKVTALNKNGTPLASSRAMTGTGTDAVVKWENDFALTSGEPVRLKFEFSQAKLYSFSFGG